MISQELLDELKIIIKEDYGIELAKQELYELAHLLISSFELLIKIDSQTKPVLSNKNHEQETA